ncbi:MAG: hypothetical protein IPM01_25600 [Burkholderiaceae bacterium]|nr:hypothetical protein [Burkholderiaceae bacterium]
MSPAFHRGAAARRLEVPSRAADLGFTVELPGDWQPHDLPDDDLNFEDPTHLMSLVVVTAPQAAIVFSAAARPAYADGTVSDWASYLLDHNGLVPNAQGGGSMGSLPALLGEATQASELGPVCVRYAFAEDGGRLISLSLTAPELVADALYGVWQHLLSTFALTTPKGPTVSVWPVANSAASAADTDPDASAASVNPAASACDADPANASQPPLEPLANHALSGDAATFDQEHPTLQRLRDNGIGLAPRVHRVDSGARSVTLACGAIMAFIDAPFGWHAIDDGRRVLVFEPTSQVQLNFSLLERPEGGFEALMEALEAQSRSDYPAPEFLRLVFGRVQVLGVRNIADRGEPIEQLHLLVDGPAPHQVLRARITSTPERTGAAGNLGVTMLHSVVFGGSGGGGGETEGEGAALATERD